MKLDGKIQNHLRNLACEVNSHGQLIYVVGGTIRDYILEKEFHDLDFACPDPAHWANWFSSRVHSKCIVLHDTPEQQVLRVPIGKSLYCDFGLLRGETINHDLALRDFTLNAIAQPLNSFLEQKSDYIDPFHGIPDIKAKTIRSLPGNPFHDDPLRMLRAFRIASVLSFDIEPNTLEQIKQLNKKITAVSGERISQELLLFFETSHPDTKTFSESGIPLELYRACGFNQISSEEFNLTINVFTHYFSALESQHNPFLSKVQNLLCSHFHSNENHALFLLATMLLPLEMSQNQSATKGTFTFKRSNSEPLRFLKYYKFSNQQQAIIDRTLLFAFQLKHLANQIESSPLSESTLYQWTRSFQDVFFSGSLLYYLMVQASEDNPSADISLVTSFYEFYTNKFLPGSAGQPLLNGHDLETFFKLPPSSLYKTILDQIEEARVLETISTRRQAKDLAQQIIDNQSMDTA